MTLGPAKRVTVITGAEVRRRRRSFIVPAAQCKGLTIGQEVYIKGEPESAWTWWVEKIEETEILAEIRY